ncbi:MAG: glycosyltransferase [Aureispira sp.]|nr:glycosyltransferase [Aureispira sp.]
MKILQLCKKFPYPLKDGEAIAVTYLSKALHKLGCELTLLSMNTTKHHFDEKALPKDFDHYKNMHLVEIDNRIKIKDAFVNLFTSKSYHIVRYISPKFEAKLIELLKAEDYDIVQLETLYLAPYVDIIRKYSKAKIVMRSHNVEHEIWKRVTENTSVGAKKWYLQLLTKRLENFEVENLNKYDMLVSITQRDLDFFKAIGCKIPTHVTPVGLELDDYTNISHQHKSKPTFGFIGSLDWMPNTEGLDWLLNKVWPLVMAKNPDAEFHIAGRNTPSWLLEKKWPNVTIHGEVASAIDFMNKHDVMVVPLFSGSGMRVKILEGMALGKTIISTKIGLEGIHAKHNEEVLIADTVEKFAEEMLRCIDGPSMLPFIGKKAQDFIHDHYDNVKIAKCLTTFFYELLGRPIPEPQKDVVAQ